MCLHPPPPSPLFFVVRVVLQERTVRALYWDEKPAVKPVIRATYFLQKNHGWLPYSEEDSILLEVRTVLPSRHYEPQSVAPCCDRQYSIWDLSRQLEDVCCLRQCWSAPVLFGLFVILWGKLHICLICLF